jgi:hypothetical protein
MLTLRALPPLGGGHPNRVLRFYYGGLLDHWSMAKRTTGHLLALLETGTRGPSKRRSLGISTSEWKLALARVDPEQILTMTARKGLHRLINPTAFPLADSALKNKHRFDELTRLCGLPIPKSFRPGVQSLHDFLENCPAIILKPNFSSKGRGIRRLVRCGANQWSEWPSVSGEKLEYDHIEAAVASGAILQEVVVTHPAVASISPNALPTMRIVTMRNEENGFEIVTRILRVGGGTHAVDNFNRGGLAALTAPDGSLGAFFRHRNGSTPEAVGSHPASAATLPHFLPKDLVNDVDRLASTAHSALVPDHAIVGWDIGLSDAGAILIEGNWNPGTNISQLLSGKSVCTERSGELYRTALERVRNAEWQAASPVQYDGRPY